MEIENSGLYVGEWEALGQQGIKPMSSECQGLQDLVKCLWMLKNQALQMDVGDGK